MNISEFLSHRDIPYTRVDHTPAYTAQRFAQAVHCSGEMVAKTVLLKVDDGFVLAVLPATHHVDLLRVQVFLVRTVSIWRPKRIARGTSSTANSARCRRLEPTTEFARCSTIRSSAKTRLSSPMARTKKRFGCR